MREEEKNQSSQWKNFFKKRWVFPAVYLVSAALLITLIVWYQGSLNNVTETPELAENEPQDATVVDEPVIEVNQSFENISMPVSNEDAVSIVTKFFDPNDSVEDQEAALIVDGNKYRPNLGVDISQNDGEAFDVTAALSGTVQDVRQDALLGNVIEVDHGDGVVTIYQSVTDIRVNAGDTVSQGEILAQSSTSQLNQAAKNHLHFELRKDNQPLNPLTYFGQPLTALAEVEQQSDVSAEEEAEADDVEESMDEEESEETDQLPDDLEIQSE